MVGDISELVNELGHYMLMWVGFGALAGLLAKAILPGKDPGGAFATMLTGIIGSLVGAGALAVMGNGFQVSPLSMVGFVVATVGATILLILYRLMGDRWLHPRKGGWWPRAHRPRQKVTVVRQD